MQIRAQALLKRRQRAIERGPVEEKKLFEKIPLYPKQAAIINDPRRFTITEATTKAGKTASHLEWLLDEAIAAGEGHWWWVATTSDTTDIAFRRAIERLNGLMQSGESLRTVGDGRKVPHVPNLTRKTIRVNGATIWFKGAEKPDNLYGEDVRAVVGDEVTRWREAAWIAVYSTLTATKGRAKLIGNVKGRKNYAYVLARKAEAGMPDWGYHKLTALDAIEGGVIDADIVEQARRDLPPEVFAALYMAEADDDGTNPFGLDAIEKCKAPLSTKPAVAFGLDLAKSVDYSVLIGLDEDGAVCYFDRWQSPWKDTIERVRRDVPVGIPCLVDSTGVGNPVLEALQEGGRFEFEGYVFSAPSKQYLMELLQVKIHQAQIRFPDGPIVTELCQIEYEHTRTGVKYGAPDNMHDDCVMSLGLAANCLDKRPKYTGSFIHVMPRRQRQTED